MNLPSKVTLVDGFSAAVHETDYLGIAMKVGNAYIGHKDKGDDEPSSMWKHIRRCQQNMFEYFEANPKNLPASRPHIMAVTILHDFPELTEGGGADKKRIRTYEQWTSELRAEGLPQDCIDDIDGAAIHEGEFYLNFIHRGGRRPVSRLVKLRADLKDHANRKDSLPETKKSQLFRDKREYLYEIAKLYYEQLEKGAISPDVHPAIFAMTSPVVPSRLKNAAVLRRNSSPCIAIPSVPTSRSWRAAEFITRRSMFGRGAAGFLGAMILRKG